MPAPKAVIELVARFVAQRDDYARGKYNETQLRRDFLDPFFEALGWDVANKLGYAEPYREVVHEDKVKIGLMTKAPDYSFRIGGARKFFVEAKKPSVDIKDDPAPALQLRRYSWSAKLPLGIVSDFEEFAVYDCRIRPKANDKATVARVSYYTIEQLIEKWDEFAGIFAKDSVLNGSFDKFATSGKRKGTTEVDDAFLEEIEGWRDALARNLANRNPELAQPELNFAVQRTIDRVIFLRICEDRGIEPEGQLLFLNNGAHIYPRLCEIFKKADERYNSGLFHFRREKEREETHDTLTLKLDIDDKVLKDIIKSLYPPESPYEFSVLSADILGQVYERFLGKVIRLTDGHRAKIEEKPDVIKAGGVWYTPKYVVDYIVEKTVSQLLAGQSVKEAACIKIVDPACGSGSFLIQAYQILLDWHLISYTSKNPEKLATIKLAPIYKDSASEWRLSTNERKRILLTSIFGVDIDSQAVEVTKLSLMLKVLEGENRESLSRDMFQHQSRVLPDLGQNIKCGNSLIDARFFIGQSGSLLNAEEKARSNFFDWKKSFPTIFTNNGGFSAIIGNPPYGATFSDHEKEFLFETYPVLRGQPESYEYFLVKALELLEHQGVLGFIVPTNFIESDRAEGLRGLLLNATWIQQLSNFRYKVWSKNASETLVVVLQKSAKLGLTRITHPESPKEFIEDSGVNIHNQATWSSRSGCRFLVRANALLIEKIESDSVPLGSISDSSQGIIVYKTREQGRENPFISDKKRGSDWLPLLDTESTVSRYRIDWGGKYLKYGDWLWCPRERKYFVEPKIVWGRLRNKSLSRRLVATIDRSGFVNRDNFNNLLATNSDYQLELLLGIFNSNVANYWYRANFDNVNVNPAQVRLIPIPRATAENLSVRQEIAALAQQALESALQVESATKVDDKHRKVFEAIDVAIDQQVYLLYRLSHTDITEIETSQ